MYSPKPERCIGFFDIIGENPILRVYKQKSASVLKLFRKAVINSAALSREKLIPVSNAKLNSASEVHGNGFGFSIKVV